MKRAADKNVASIAKTWHHTFAEISPTIVGQFWTTKSRPKELKLNARVGCHRISRRHTLVSCGLRRPLIAPGSSSTGRTGTGVRRLRLHEAHNGSLQNSPKSKYGELCADSQRTKVAVNVQCVTQVRPQHRACLHTSDRHGLFMLDFRVILIKIALFSSKPALNRSLGRYFFGHAISRKWPPKQQSRAFYLLIALD